MRLGHIELFVREPLAAKDFYVDVLGFELLDVQAEALVWLRLGGQEFLLRPGTPPAPAPSYAASSHGLVLFTDDLEGTKRRLEDRGLEFRGTDGSDDCPVFMDPDGHWFQLVDPRSHE